MHASDDMLQTLPLCTYQAAAKRLRSSDAVGDSFRLTRLGHLGLPSLASAFLRSFSLDSSLRSRPKSIVSNIHLEIWQSLYLASMIHRLGPDCNINLTATVTRTLKTTKVGRGRVVLVSLSKISEELGASLLGTVLRA
jgi:hypothetical protein